MKYSATSGSHGPGQEADNPYFRFSWTIPHTKREFQASHKEGISSFVINPEKTMNASDLAILLNF